MDTQLVFDAAHVYTAVTLVVDEHGQAAAVLCSLFRACQHEVQVGIAVRDETLHAVQAPAVVGFIVSGFQHHALQVGTGIGFGQVHGHGFTGADAGNETAVLVFVTELVKSLDTVLQRPDVAKAGIGGSYDFRAHGVRGNREVQSAETARHGHTVESGLYHGVEVLFGAAGIFHTAVGTMRAFFVHAFGIGRDNLTRNLTGDFEYLVVGVDCIRIILRCIIELVFIFVAAFFQFADTLHHRIVQVILEFRNICIKISHIVFPFRS